MCNVLFHVPPDKQKVVVKNCFPPTLLAKLYPHLQNRGAALATNAVLSVFIEFYARPTRWASVSDNCLSRRHFVNKKCV